MNRWTQRLLIIFFTMLVSVSVKATPERPNILWIVAEDTSPWMGCYGDAINANATPNIDAMARAGVRFARAFVPAPVCSPCRSALMAGQNQIRFGAHEHRSSRGPVKIQLPKGMKLLPRILREHGYFTFNLGKEDYNFVWDQQATYSLKVGRARGIPWEKFKENQPFFGQIQTKGGKNNTSKFPEHRKTSPAGVTVPPDYPQNQLYREVVAQHYDAIRKDDDYIGTILGGLEASGMAGNTIVVYFSDHGANNLVRHKQMVTEGGLHVPLIVTGPKKFVPDQKVRHDLVSLLDVSATTLAWSGVDIPDWYEGQHLFGADFKARTFVASAKDRMDHTIDRVRSVRTDRFRYTRNYKLDRIFLQPQYRDRRPFTVNLRELHAAGQLSPKLREIYFGERPAEELYDVSRDPHQLHNLANDPAYNAELRRHRQLLDSWLARGDMGAGEEPEAELKYQADGHKWGRGVNPEYEGVREDSDGDGLSDQWEEINGRDPRDGRLVFDFDCGGWQTEGWKSNDIKSNLAGFLGSLDFTLEGDSGTIQRGGLHVTTTRNDRSLVIRVRSSEALKILLSANGKPLGDARELTASSSRVSMKWSLSPELGWSGVIKMLTCKFSGKKGATIEIDSIAVERRES